MLIALLLGLIIILLITMGIMGFYLFRFASVIMTFEDDLSEAVESFNMCERTFDKILHMKLFFDSPEVKHVVMDVMNEIKMCKLATFNMVQKFTQRSKEKYINIEEDDEEEQELYMMTPPPLGRKKISRRKPGEKTLKNYFDDSTQEAIVQFQQETDKKNRERIYIDSIMPAFDTLIENLINVYGYNVMYESKTDLKTECIEFLYGVIHKFNAAKGSKAFSYFNVVAKHWLTIKSKQNAKNVQTYMSIDNREFMSQRDLDVIENYKVLPSCDEVVSEEEIKGNLKKLFDELKVNSKTENELLCVDAITFLLKNIDDIDIISKRACLLYVREITGLNAKQSSMALSAVRKYYKEVRSKLIQEQE